MHNERIKDNRKITTPQRVIPRARGDREGGKREEVKKVQNLARFQ
ncbi:hypothetical protein SLEP1_g25798 [Rubroshorea leprosula]|uniref:Uncharacterized protein n=1 Tax=Rubroshorea leprosula TaxID=152421 RepID=A0AAV5JN55_9ROSI|nr:hypothetical protein SLEP1_g25798 [Rubroshorea leprosula]